MIINNHRVGVLYHFSSKGTKQVMQKPQKRLLRIRLSKIPDSFLLVYEFEFTSSFLAAAFYNFKANLLTVA